MLCLGALGTSVQQVQPRAIQTFMRSLERRWVLLQILPHNREEASSSDYPPSQQETTSLVN